MFERSVLVACVLVCVVHGARATDCKDAAVVVVASVFATLAVVFLVLGIVGFLIWKRRRDIAGPSKLKNEPGSSAGSSPDGAKQGYSNPAFDRDPEMGDPDVPGYVPCRDKASENRKDEELVLDDPPLVESAVAPRSLADNVMAQKTWSSLPGSDVPYGRSRKSSTGSLDGNNYQSEDSLVEVWLTSQDFIGLGFNIAGSMRDGIFVSQVHNRGPANESGKFKVGDRIMSVAISFENMVYEDALTILSYASPYPVKVTLQKEQQMPNNRRLSEVRTPLNHPLYRSQSVDAINVVPKETIPVFHPKRAASEMRYDRRNSPKMQRTSKGGTENDIMEEGPTTPATDIEEVFHKNIPVHRRKSEKEKVDFNREVSIPIETDLPVASVDLNSSDKKAVDSEGKAPSNGGPFIEAFENLTEQDKLDMLMLSYDDPDNGNNTQYDAQKQVVEAEINHQAVNADLRNAPMKPERKKKRSSTNSSTPSTSDGDSSNFSSPRLMPDVDINEEESPAPPSEAPPPVPDDVFESSFGTNEDSNTSFETPSEPHPSFPPPSELPPPLPEDYTSPSFAMPIETPPPVPDNDREADEEVIQPQMKQRDIAVNSNTIVLAPMSNTQLDVSDVSIDRTVVADASFSDASFSELDNTLVNSARPESPEEAAVEEEEICATQAKKDELIYNGVDAVLHKPRDVVPDSVRETKDIPSDNSVENNETQENNENNTVDTGSQEGDDFDKDLPKLDMNLNFDTFATDSVIFQENFPSRNERESDKGLAYDISVVELESMERKFRDNELTKSENQIGKGGIAFEVRDDADSGNTRTINTNSVHRTVSYELKKPTDFLVANEISWQRPTSLKGDSKRPGETETGVLDWSGKRLVRSGSFTEIPQDDSVKNWTDQQHSNVDDSIIEQHIEEDSKSQVLKTLTRATFLQSNKAMENLSDSDSQCRSLSSSGSTRSSSPGHVDSFDGTNGEDDGLGMSPDSSPGKITATTPDMKSELISSVANYGENEQALTVTLNTADDEEDC